MTDTPDCDCVCDNKWGCFAIRHDLDTDDAHDIEMEGGPCDCPCHDAEEDDNADD